MTSKFIPLVGHSEIIENLNECLEHNRLPHGLLFVGPKGVGKSTLAYHLAYSLFSAKKLTTEIELEDPLFRRLLNGSHGDFKHIRLGTNEDGKPHQEIPLDAIREIIQFLQVTPLEGGWRVVVIEDAEFLGRKGANALLKSLEEPPSRTLLILCASQDQQVLPTLKSRCQRFTFKKLTDDQVAQVLMTYQPFMEDDLKLLKLFSEGAPGRAILFSELGGNQFYQELLTVLQAAVLGKQSSLLSFIEKYSQAHPESSFDPYRSVGYFISWWLGRYLIDKNKKSSNDFISGEQQRQILDRFSTEFWEQHYHKINFFYHHPHVVGLDRKYCLAFLLLGFVFGPQAYNEGITNEFR